LAGNSKKQELFAKAMFDVEHALNMYAYSFCTIPAQGIYDKKALEPLMSTIENCHIYLIGYLPVIDLIDVRQVSNRLSMSFSILNNQYPLEFDIPEGVQLKQDEKLYYLENEEGKRCWPNELWLQNGLCNVTDIINFEVKYIGQAYGNDGSRNAIDRLLKHETLQKISLQGVPAGYSLSLLMLEVHPSNRIFTIFNPFAKDSEEGPSRMKSGLDKLFGTSEQERIALYEASLIRYFSPQFNKEFKNSFPSTNLKILQDCYEKDFAAVTAEICIDELPFRLFSESVKVSHYHIAKHDLHNDEDRKFFFGF